MNNEDKKLRRAFIASVIAVVISGIILVATCVVSLIQIGRATDSNATKYDMNCVTQPIEKPLTECKE